MQSEAKLAYLAGLVDGEGCITSCIHNTPKGIQAMNLSFTIYNTNKKLIEWVIGNFGGVVFSRKRKDSWKEEHQVKWKPADASGILIKLLPYLVIKKEQAEVFIAMHSTKGNRISEATHKYRIEMDKRIKELNKRGTI